MRPADTGMAATHTTSAPVRQMQGYLVGVYAWDARG
jgi:hypothetical protein